MNPSWRAVEPTQREIELSGSQALVGGLGVRRRLGVKEDPGRAFVQGLKKPGQQDHLLDFVGGDREARARKGGIEFRRRLDGLPQLLERFAQGPFELLTAGCWNHAFG